MIPAPQSEERATDHIMDMWREDGLLKGTVLLVVYLVLCVVFTAVRWVGGLFGWT